MSDNATIRAHYEQLPYPDRVFHFTHPRHTGALARLYGHPATPDPAAARVLDVGCGQGANLRRIARDLPAAECLGLDLAEAHIDEARRRTEDEGLKNVRFVQADVLDHDFSGERFDYVIAHGFFSWVPDQARERLLSICRDHLTPDGIAVVSYNCLPGWSMRVGLRQLMQLENEETGSSGRGLLRGAERIREFFERTLPAVGQMPHAPLLRNEIENLRRKDADTILHDELEPLNEPLYLLQFAQWAKTHDLAYVGDTSLLADWLDVYPKEIRQAVSERRMSRMHALQYVDFLVNRDFRRSIICPAGAGEQLSGHPTPESLDGLWVASRLRADAPSERGDAVSYRFIPEAAPPGLQSENAPESSEALRISDPLEQACLDELASSLGRFRPIDEIVESARRLAGSTGADRDDRTRLAEFILRKVAQGCLRVSLGPVVDDARP